MTSSFDNWQAPISLGVLEIKPFPIGVFPEEIEKFVSELSRSTETPLDLAATTTLSGIATAAHDKYIVQIKPDYSEPINIWTAVALPPGCRKSAVLFAVMKPIIEYEALLQEKITPLIAENISKNKSLEFRIKEMRGKASRSKAIEYEQLQREIIELEAHLEEIPAIPQLWTADITPENLGTLMVANNECMSILSDEAGIFDTLAGRYSSGIPNLDLFLKSHSGTSARINRAGRPPDLLHRPILTMGLTPQPDVLKGIGKNNTFRGRGLLGRFLYALPHSNLGDRDLNAAPMDVEIKQGYHQVIAAILSHQTEDKSYHILRLSKASYGIWHLYSREVEIQMSEGGPFAFMTDWAGKLPGQITRIASLLHIARHAKDSPRPKEISEEDMKAAIKIGRYFSAHAIAVFELMGTDPSIDGAKTILKWLNKNKLTQFTFRECHYAHKSRFKRTKELEPCVEILVENYFIKEQKAENPNHRPSRIFEVNPFLYQQKE